MRAALVFLIVAVAAASCQNSADPPGLSDPNVHPPVIGGGGDGGSTVDGGATDATTSGPCADAPSMLAGFTAQRVLFVAPDGNDTNDGKSRAAAWRTLANAGAELQPGDRVDVFAGTYTCNAEIGVHASAGRPVWIRSVDGPKKAIFNCGGAGFGVHIVNAKYVAIDGFDITASQLDGVLVDSGGGPPFTDLADHILLVNNHVHGTGGAGIRVMQATNVGIFGNEIDTTEAFGTNASAQGIDLVAVSGARIVGNSVHDVRSYTAIQVRGGAFDTRIAANVLRNDMEGIHLGGTTDRTAFLPADSDVEAQGVVAHSNVIAGATSIAFAAIGCKGCLIANNTVVLQLATQPVRALPGATGSTSNATVSQTSDLRLVNNVFSFSGMTPTDLLAIPSSQEVGFLQSNNLFFLAGGMASSISSDVPIGGTGTVLDKDPQLATDDSLTATSPANGAGTALAEVTYNAAGQCRTTWNIGAY